MIFKSQKGRKTFFQAAWINIIFKYTGLHSPITVLQFIIYLRFVSALDSTFSLKREGS